MRSWGRAGKASDSSRVYHAKLTARVRFASRNRPLSLSAAPRINFERGASLVSMACPILSLKFGPTAVRVARLKG